jgi:hypothetical protein
MKETSHEGGAVYRRHHMKEVCMQETSHEGGGV